MSFKNISLTLFLMVVAGLLGIGAERFLLSDHSPAVQATSAETVQEHARKHLDPDYVCPMHPDVVAAQPGSCPICGMDLVEKPVDSGILELSAGLPEVSVNPGFIHNFGVRTTTVTRGAVQRKIESIGRVARMSQSRITEVAAPFSGKLVTLIAKEVGEQVLAGQRLFTLDAPDWRRLQQRYLTALKDEDASLQAQLKQHLGDAGMTPERIKRLGDKGEIEQILDVWAPVPGAVVTRIQEAGDRVEAQAKVITLGASRRIPVIVSAFEGQGAWIKRGQRVVVRVPTLPDTGFEGIVDRTDREINFSTRTLPVYVGFNTADPRIRYGMLVDVTIEAAARRNVLRVPREALIRTGSGTRVIVARGEGRFQPVAVETGLESGDIVEILSGLEEGQQVVTSGQFLIDSESNLKAGLRRMDAGHDTP